jgi:chromosome segregation ATPase
MPEGEDDETARRVRKLVVEHAETRWLALHMDNDIQEIRGELREVRAKQKTHDERFDRIDAQLQEHTELLQAHSGRFDSLDAQMRSLTQMIGKVLDRLPAPGQNGN